MKFCQKFIENEKLRRWIVLLLMIALIYFLRSILPLVLLTFIFSYLAYRFVNFVKVKTKLSEKLIAPLLYGSILVLIYLGITQYLPVLIKEITHLVNAVAKFYQVNNQTDSEFMSMIYQFLKEYNLMGKLQTGMLTIMSYVTSFGKGLMIFAFAFLMSFFFTIDRKETNRFSNLFLESDLAWFFEDIHYLAKKFVRSFGVVIETQFIIALVNTGLTVLVLSALKFPELFSLGVMIFVLSLIPVAGVLISCIPLTVIAYSVGGLKDVLIILSMILLIHALESYVLNPRLMSQKTKVPIFYTFIILFLGEHFFGVWGLLTGIPLFNFALDLLNVKALPLTPKLPPK